MKKVIFPGSFDPLTLGHINLIERIRDQVDQVIVLVSFSETKTNLFSSKERCELIKENFLRDKQVFVEEHKGLTIDYMKKHGIKTIVRGARGFSDYEMEESMSCLNKKMYKEIETFILFSDPNFTSISSRFVKEIAKNAGDLSSMVPENVLKKLIEKFKNNN